MDEIVFVVIPVDFKLGLPLELLRVSDFFIEKFPNDITGVSVHSDHTHELHTHGFGEITLDHFD